MTRVMTLMIPPSLTLLSIMLGMPAELWLGSPSQAQPTASP